jgi:hypothetical protein
MPDTGATAVRKIAGLMLFGLMTLLAFVAFQPKLSDALTAVQFLGRMRTDWAPQEWVALLAPVAAYVLAQIFHWMDNKWKGGGIRNRVYSIEGKHYVLDSGVLSATMTKQSVLAAIAAILLALIQGKRGTLSLVPMDNSFPVLMAELSTLGFLVSIVLLLVSMKCYDYANRFNLEDVYRAELVSKGLDLDIWSWYTLLCALVYGIAVISAAFSILTSFVTGYLLWWYYFVHPSHSIRRRFIS